LEKNQAFSTDDPFGVLPRIRRAKNKISQVRKITGPFSQRGGGILLSLWGFTPAKLFET
jgi:hypothetical protein